MTKLQSIFRNIVSCTLALAIFNSCASNPEAAGLIAGIGGYAAGRALGLSEGQSALVGAGIGAITYVISKKYQMDEEQRQIAAIRARRAMQREEVRRHRYVAVPVPKRKRSTSSSSSGRAPKSDLAVIDTKTGETVSNNAYETNNAAQLQNGKNVKVGGYNAYVYNTFQGV